MPVDGEAQQDKHSPVERRVVRRVRRLAQMPHGPGGEQLGAALVQTAHRGGRFQASELPVVQPGELDGEGLRPRGVPGEVHGAAILGETNSARGRVGTRRRHSLHMTISPHTLAAADQAAPSARPPRPDRGEVVELTIDSLAFGGEGVARMHDGGYVVFVSGGVPGDRVRAVITKRKRSYAHARLVELLEAAPDRVPALADHPGAPWQVIPYERQLEIKHSQVQEALRRLGGLDGFQMQDIVPAVERWRYRNKLEYSFGEDADGRLVCGFHAPGRFDEILPMEDCLLASEPANVLRRERARLVSRGGIARLGPALRRRAAAQPRRARGAAHRRAPGAPRDLRRATSTRGLWRGASRRTGCFGPA